MSPGAFDEFDDKFEDEETWLDDFDDRDAVFDEAAEISLLDQSGIEWSNLGGSKRNDLGFLLGSEGEEEGDGDEVAA